MAPNKLDPKSAKGRYEKLQTTRDPYLRRARDAAEVTIPSLIPKDGSNGSTNFPTPYQSMGSRGVNNLASKLLLALLPPNHPFFRLTLDEFTLDDLASRDDESGKIKTEFETTLGKVERTVMSELENNSARVAVFEGLKHLIVGGNVLLYLAPEGGIKVYRLDKYVSARDPMGNLIELIVKEKIAFEALKKEVQDALTEKKQGRKFDDEIELYTYVRRDGGKYRVHQEAEDIKIDGTDGTYPLDKTPWLALRYAKIDGEDYGRGHVEEYMGDLNSLEGLSEAIVEGSAAAAKVLFLVDPNGLTEETDISTSENLAVRSGRRDDVGVLQLDKYADFRIALETSDRVTQRLAQAFLLTSAVTRDAERVTAEEIRLMAGELEDALGGVYSILSQEFQLPLVKRVMYQLQKKKKLPQLPEKHVKPAITTGMEALGRGHDLNRLLTFSRIMRETLGEEEVKKVLHTNVFADRVSTGLGMSIEGMIKTAEEVQALNQAEAEANAAKTLGPAQIQAQSRVTQEQVKQNGSPQAPR